MLRNVFQVLYWLVGVFLVIGLSFLIAAALFFGLKEAAGEWFRSKATQELVRQFTSAIAYTLVVYLFVRFFLRKNFKPNLNFSNKDLSTGFLMGLCLFCPYITALLLFTGTSIAWQFGDWPQTFTFSAFFFLAAFSEEMLFRVYVLNALSDKIGNVASLFVSSVLFSAIHLFNPAVGLIAVVNVFLAGMLLGMCYVWKKNIWLPTALHFSWNFLTGAVFGLPVSGITMASETTKLIGPKWLTGGSFGAEGSLATTIANIIILGLVAGYVKKGEHQEGGVVGTEAGLPKS